MSRFITRALTACLLILLHVATPRANAWGSPGHMAVAYVAWQRLTPATRIRVQALLQLNPYYKTWQGFIPAGTSQADTDLYLFMMAATWPDEIKANGSGYTGNDTPPSDISRAAQNTGYTDMQLHKYWHFIDTPYSPDNTAPTKMPVPNLETEIALLRSAIQTTEADPIKSYDLVWLEHLVGDVHQPLHCVSRYIAGKSDGGGNSIVLTGTPNELHAFWDDLPGIGSTQNFAKAVTFARTLKPPPAAKAADASELHWVSESVRYATLAAYKAPIAKGTGPYTITPAYKATALADAKLRIALAGARLANLLNAAFDPSAARQ